MSKEYKSGDLVVLKSGGPVMTVKDTGLISNDEVTCQWFSGKKLEMGHFSVDSLKDAPKEESK